MKPEQKAIGIDIGATKIAVAAVNDLGEVKARTTLPTEAERGFDRAIERLSQAILTVCSEAGWPSSSLVGIGIGCAGPVDPYLGTINNPYTLAGWDNCDIITPLRKRFGIPVWLENDADAAGLGECFMGAGRGFDPVIMLTFGSGIGGAAIVNNRIYRGVAGGHPELGHIPIETDGPLCYCGIHGCFEALASGTAIAEAGAKLGFSSSRDVFSAAAAGKAEARAIIDRAMRATVSAAWTLAHTFMPQRIILGGGLMEEHSQLFIPLILERIAKATMVVPALISVAPAVLGNAAGVVGAASLALRASSAR